MIPRCERNSRTEKPPDESVFFPGPLSKDYQKRVQKLGKQVSTPRYPWPCRLKLHRGRWPISASTRVSLARSPTSLIHGQPVVWTGNLFCGPAPRVRERTEKKEGGNKTGTKQKLVPDPRSPQAVTLHSRPTSTDAFLGASVARAPRRRL